MRKGLAMMVDAVRFELLIVDMAIATRCDVGVVLPGHHYLSQLVNVKTRKQVSTCSSSGSRITKWNFPAEIQ